MNPIARHLSPWLAALLLGASLHAAATPGAPPPGAPQGQAGPTPEFGPAAQPMLRHPVLPPGLVLSEAQEDQLFELHHAQAPRLRQLEREAESSLKELHALRESAAYDATKALTLAERHGRALAALLLARTELDVRSRAILSDEQRQSLNALRTGPQRPPAGEPSPSCDAHRGGHLHVPLAEPRP